MVKVIIFDTHGVVLSGKRFSTIPREQHENAIKKAIAFIKHDLQTYLQDHKKIEDAVGHYLTHLQEKPQENFLKYSLATEQYIDKRLIVFIMGLRHRGIRCYLSTSQDTYKIEYMKEHMGLDMLFDGIFSTVELHATKGEPVYFKKILDQLPNVTAGEVLYWDDMDVDVEAARHAGMQAEVYKGIGDFRKKMKKYVAEE